ncbi:MAG: exodeoxyribonuclease-1, partial [Bacteroidia bacterium]
ATAQRLGISGDRARAHLAALREYRKADGAAFEQLVQEVYSSRKFPEQKDPDLMLYGGGFFSGADKRLMDDVRAETPEGLATTTYPFEDSRLPHLLFRYRARNFPESLSAEEQAEWEEYRYQRLTEPDGGGSICLDAFQEEIESLLASDEVTDEQRQLLNQLLDYADTLLS